MSSSPLSSSFSSSSPRKQLATPPKRPKRNKDRTPFLNSKFSTSASNVTEQELLNFYGLSTLDPMEWSEEQPSLSSSQSSMASINRSTPPPQAYFTTQEGLDPLGIKSNVLRDLPAAMLAGTGGAGRETVSVFSKQFRPDVFLASVHPTLSYQQFEEGLHRMGHQGEQQNQVMRRLVRENFSAHIVAKTTVDSVFRTMRERELNGSNEFQTLPFTETMEIGATTASQVFGPILAKRAQCEKIKATLLVLERFKFFFNLPSTLNAAVQQGHLVRAVRDYKKGKTLMQALYPSLLGGDLATNFDPIPPQQKKFFEKIWTSVSHTMQFVKEHLFKQLNEHDLSVETQEQAIQLILEMDPVVDPIWVYLESRFKWILTQLKERLSMQFRATFMQEDTNGKSPTTKFTAVQFRKAILLRNKKEFETVFAKDNEVIAWRSLTQLVRALSEGIVALLPDFNKMARAYMDPKKPRGAVDLERQALCKRMPYELVSYLAMLLRHAFHLALKENLPVFPPLTNLNSLTVAHFAPKITQSFVHCFDQLQSLQLPNEALSVLETLQREIQESMIHLLLSAWKEDARMIPSLEDWQITNDVTAPSAPSPLITLYGSYTKYFLQTTFKVWTLQSAQKKSFSDMIFPHLFTTVQVFLETLQSVPNMEDRVILSFVSHLDHCLHMAQHWVTYLTNLSGATPANAGSLTDFIHAQKKDLLRSFVRKQVAVMDPILLLGLAPAQDWTTFGPPSAIRPWVFQVLMHLNALNVLLATILPVGPDSADADLDVLPQVLLGLAQSMLAMVRRLEHVAPGSHAGKQLALELLFLQHSLHALATPHFTSLFASMHTVLACPLDTLQTLLTTLLRATHMQFYCFAHTTAS